MALHFYVDNRESFLKERLMCARGLEGGVVKLANLDIGDVAVAKAADDTPKADDTNEFIGIFERKTMADLSASIKDGRHREQKARLLEWRKGREGRRVYYVIEGFGTAADRALVSSVMNTLFRDDIITLFMRDASETAEFFTEAFVRFLEDPAKYGMVTAGGGAAGSGIGIADSYISQVKMKKNKNITPENVFVFQLSQIPGISTKIAMGIAAVHPTMSHFVRALDAYGTDLKAKVRYVENLPLEEGGRKVGKKTAAKIIEHI